MARLVYAALVAAMAFVLPGFGGPGAVADHSVYHEMTEDTKEAQADLEAREQERRLHELEDEARRDDLTGGNQTNAAPVPAGGYIPPPVAVSVDDLLSGELIAMPQGSTFVTVCDEREGIGREVVDGHGYVQTLSVCMLVHPQDPGSAP